MKLTHKMQQINKHHEEKEESSAQKTSSMQVKIIKLPKNSKPKDAEAIFKLQGYSSVKLSVDRRYKKKHTLLP